ncbi:DNA ligase 1-like [Rutidosis leptorrhynchoides]|uniref:DNA ligase 1-like n=1 Tax=Rutidosis leptorrhynchoides TaxID=125765 RepID=UPI003A98FC42
MSNARATTNKNKSQSSSSSASPKKRKTLVSKQQIDSIQIVKPIEPKQEAASNPDQKEQKPHVSNGSNQVLANPNFEEEKRSKKQKVSTVDDSITQLKKKAVKFDPKTAAYWDEGERVPFLFLGRVFDAVSNESGRIAITEIVCNMLRTVIDTTPDDLVAVVYLLANRIAPAHDWLELGIGDASIIKALAEACGAKETHIKKQYKELGDLGLVAKASRSSQPLMRKPQPLTVAKVFDTFRVIAKVDVCIYAFDLLYVNGHQLLQEQLNIRRERLYESFEEEPGFFQLATAITSDDLEEIQTFLDTAVNASCEGLIIKTLTKDATYEPAKRSNNWLKLKKDYMDSTVTR